MRKQLAERFDGIAAIAGLDGAGDTEVALDCQDAPKIVG
jgi:hypothetical protein